MKYKSSCEMEFSFLIKNFQVQCIADILWYWIYNSLNTLYSLQFDIITFL